MTSNQSGKSLCVYPLQTAQYIIVIHVHLIDIWSTEIQDEKLSKKETDWGTKYDIYGSLFCHHGIKIIRRHCDFILLNSDFFLQFWEK